jgi:hypothetical protein
MPLRSPGRPSGLLAVGRLSTVLVATILVTSTMSVAQATTGSSPSGRQAASQTVTFRGYRVAVPRQWRVVDLRSTPHACLRFDQPAVYVGRPGDQSACPAGVIGGAPGLLIQPLDRQAEASVARSSVAALPTGAVQTRLLPATGPVNVDEPNAGVMVTAVYGARSASVLRQVLAGGGVVPSARALEPAVPAANPAPSLLRASLPGSYLGLGFDACTAPTQQAMDAWHASSGYSSVGVYIGGVSRGCAQPNLTASWVARQVSSGWHLIPTYVGRQAACSRFYNRMSYDPATAWAQGRAEAADATARARALGIPAPSTIYSDVEGYDTTGSRCVASVLSWVSGWTRGLHENGYDSGVYSSASSGIRDLGIRYRTTSTKQPDDIWIAWWNQLADAAGGSYIADTLWSRHQRIHQYVGGVYESHGGYRIGVDRDYLDLSSAVQRPQGCPTNLDFTSYPAVHPGGTGSRVRAVQCQLARRGFNPGTADATMGWRTRAAIRAFKVSRGLVYNNAVGRRAWTALLSGGSKVLLQKGAAGPTVSKLQRALSASLVRTVDITGTFDRTTRRAVLDYQRAHDLTVDGTANRQTWAALQAGE